MRLVRRWNGTAITCPLALDVQQPTIDDTNRSNAENPERDNLAIIERRNYAAERLEGRDDSRMLTTGLMREALPGAREPLSVYFAVPPRRRNARRARAVGCFGLSNTAWESSAIASAFFPSFASDAPRFA